MSNTAVQVQPIVLKKTTDPFYRQVKRDCYYRHQEEYKKKVREYYHANKEMIKARRKELRELKKAREQQAREQQQAN